MKDPASLDRIVEAVLYEGYILYPYRASSKKNLQRFTFGRVYPADYSQAQRGAEPCTMQTECLVRTASAKPSVEIRVRFLQPMWREVWVRQPGSGDFALVPQFFCGNKLYQTWQESVERDITLPRLRLDQPNPPGEPTVFHFPASEALEPINNHARLHRRRETLDGEIALAVEPVNETVSRVQVRITNCTPVPTAALDNQDAILLRTFASTHTILRAEGAEFISLLEPSPEFADAAAQCRNVGTWPVLVGDAAAKECDTLLSSPIILYDYPQTAPESPGTLFDGAEIDEILTLRIMTMTDDEKREARHLDEHARRMLERTEGLTDENLLRLHGVMRQVSPQDMVPPEDHIWGSNTRLDGVNVHDTWITTGDHVRIRPKRRADAMDLFLDGKTAVVEAVEQDAEGAVHLALVLEDDPGKDLGMMRQPGHRFFYTSDEVEPVNGGR